MLLTQQRKQLPLLGSRANVQHLYLRPLLPKRHRVQPCQYAILETGDIVSSELVKGLMLSAVTTQAVKKAYSALARKAAVDAFVARCCIQFNVSDRDELQDLLAALILSECVYKKLEMPPEQLAGKISEFLAEFPQELVHLEAVQLSLEDVTQNYLVAVGGRSVYVAFMGTKQARDVQTDLAFSHEAVWAAEQISGRASEVPSAHRGFLARAKSVPIKQLQALAEGSGRRLVLCGHSLGGAVAKLVGLKLLRESPEWLPPPSIRVICFATPAVGNNALASLVEEAGWSQFFKTYVLPEDQLMRMLRFTVAQPAAAVAAAAAAAAGGGMKAGSSGSSSKGGSPAGTAAIATGKHAAAAAAAGGHSSSSTSSSSRRISTDSGPGISVQQQIAAGFGAVGDLLRRPFARESAKEQLRKELRAEEANTPTLDGAAIDLTDTAAAAVHAAPLHATASSVSGSSSKGPFGLAGKLWNRSQQQQQQRLLPESAAAAAAAGATRQAPSSEDVQKLAAVAESAAAADAGSSSSSTDQAAAAAAAAPSGLANIGYVIQLQGNWVAYQLAQMGRVAMEPLTTAKRAVSVFHPFGVYEYITVRGVESLDKTQLPDSNSPLAPEAAAFQEANPGPFSFHRMVAYRTRCFQMINKIAVELAQQGLVLPSAAAAAASSSASRGLGLLADPREWQMVHPTVKIGTVVPQMRVQSVLARPPLRSPSLLLPNADDALAPTGAAEPAAASVRRGALAFLPGGRGSKPPEPTIQLVCKVQGSNLHLCRKVGVLVFGEQYQPTFLVSSSTSGHGLLLGGQAASTAWTIGSSSSDPKQQSSSAASSSSSRFAPLAMLGPVFTRVKQAAVAAAKAYEGDRPRWRTPTDTEEQVTMQILLPVSVVDRLLAAAASGSSMDRQQQQQEGLVLQLKSDFELLSVPVQLKHHTVGIVGSSSRAAALMRSLLAHSGELQQHYQQQVAAAAAAGSSTAQATGLQRWLPQPQKWISTRQQQQQQPQQRQQPVEKVKAAANLAAAAGASVAAARLATISRQILGRRGSAAAGLQNPSDLEPAAKRLRAAAAAAGSSSIGSVGVSMSSIEEPSAAAAAAALASSRSPSPSTAAAGGSSAGSSGGSSGSSMAKAAAAATMSAAGNVPHDHTLLPSPLQQQQPASGSSSSSSTTGLISRLGMGTSNSAATAAAATVSSSSRKGGLSGVQYTTLPIKPSPLLLPLPAAAAAPSFNSDGHSLYQVLRRATRQLQRQQQQQGSVALHLLQSARSLGSRATGAAAKLGAAAAAVGGALPGGSKHAGSSSSRADSHAGRPAAPAAAAAAARKSVKQKVGFSARQQQQHSAHAPAAAAAPTVSPALLPHQQQQQQQWDVLLLPVTFDTDYIQLMKCKAAMEALAAAAAAAGVQVVPLLLLESDESVMTVNAADLQAAGLHNHSQPVLSQHHQRVSNLQGLLRLDDAAAQLAAALHLPAAAVYKLHIGDLLSHSYPSSSSSSSRKGLLISDESSPADVLGAVGGLAQQRLLLQGLQRLEGYLAGLLQQKHNTAMGLQQAKL